MIKKINKSYVTMIWQALSDAPNVDNCLFKLNLNNIENINTLINKLILPSYEKMPDFLKARCKDSFKYAINFCNDKELFEYYEDSIPEVYLPSYIKIKDFYIIVWTALFNKESYYIDDKFLYQEIPFSELYEN